jgi:hypothetical protein
MATLACVKEKVHYPLYDAFVVQDRRRTFADVVGPGRRIRFFTDIHGKTRLDTNLQAAGVLPRLNTFEARALRVAVSQLGRCTVHERHARSVLDTARRINATRGAAAKKPDAAKLTEFTDVLQQCLHDCQTEDEATALAELIYGSVLSLIVGEKVMIEMPTFWFPSGAGVHSQNGSISHGAPDPMATFRFAEPVAIEARESFRAEISFPAGVPPALAQLAGPFRLWVVLDGYLTRDVQ